MPAGNDGGALTALEALGAGGEAVAGGGLAVGEADANAEEDADGFGEVVGGVGPQAVAPTTASRAARGSASREPRHDSDLMRIPGA